MLLKDYFPNIGKKYEKTFFSDICFESSKVKKDNVFFAIKGTNIDVNNFILDAINKGSKIIVTEKKIKKNLDTKYQQKALKFGRKINYLNFKKNDWMFPNNFI